MPLEQVKFGGLASLLIDEQVGIDAALDASDCVLDDGSLRGRNGYRAATASALATGTMQALSRLRVSPTFARTIAVINGGVYAVTDPSTETASDGSVQTVNASVFGTSAAISAVQLGQYTYLSSDDSTVAWRRARKSSTTIALDTLTTLAKGVTPTSAVSSPSILKYSTSGSWALSASVTKTAVATDWWVFQRTAAHVLAGDTATYTFPASYDWTSYNWLQVFVSPPVADKGGGHIKVSLATSSGSFEDVGECYDTPGGGAPNVLFVQLSSLTNATRQAVNKIRFTVTGSDGFFYVYGHLAIPAPPGSGEQLYFVTFYNSSTKQESDHTDELSVQLGSASIAIPAYHSVYTQYDSWIDAGQGSADPAAIPTARNFNAGAGQAQPTTNDYAGVVTISGAIPTGDQYPASDGVRLWRNTASGYRLVKTLALTGGETTYAIIDDVGVNALANQSYRPQGAPPACNALAARGGRLICGGGPSLPNRLFISSYVPINTTLENTTSDPYPQFPAIPQDDSDGYSFDISPTAAEQILALVNGDALYILTNEACYSMYDLGLQQLQQPAPYKVFERGTIGRRAAIWAEERLFYAGHDGIYMCRNRSSVEELTEPIRRLYLSWFLPDSSVILGYQDRKLYAVRGTRMLRYDFVTSTWTRHTLAHTMQQAAFWKSDADATQRLWILGSAGNLYRWQPGVSPSDTNRATSDGGTSISAWTYSTGFDLAAHVGGGEPKTRIGFVFVDTSGTVSINAYKDTGTSNGCYTAPGKSFTSAGEHELPFPPKPTGYKWRLALTAANTVNVKRLMYERGLVDGKGG